MNVLTERLAAELAVCDAATEGPWEDRREHLELARIVHSSEAEFNLAACMDCGTEAGLLVDADAEFIATARTGYPAVLKALQAVLDTVEHYPVPSKYDDPTGDIGGAVEAFGRAVEAAITKHLGATP